MYHIPLVDTEGGRGGGRVDVGTVYNKTRAVCYILKTKPVTSDDSVYVKT